MDDASTPAIAPARWLEAVAESEAQLAGGRSCPARKSCGNWMSALTGLRPGARPGHIARSPRTVDRPHAGGPATGSGAARSQREARPERGRAWLANFARRRGGGIVANPALGLAAPRPYPHLALPGRLWIKAGRYWVTYRGARWPSSAYSSRLPRSRAGCRAGSPAVAVCSSVFAPPLTIDHDCKRNLRGANQVRVKSSTSPPGCRGGNGFLPRAGFHLFHNPADFPWSFRGMTTGTAAAGWWS